MVSSQRTKLFVAAWVATNLAFFAGFSGSARAQDAKVSNETTNMTVIVKESDTGEPIGQAHITLQFSEPGGAARFGKNKKIAYSAKTDAQGRYKFAGINKGPIVLTVTAVGHQTYGKELQLERNNQVFEVNLKKPQPLI
jgi:hypothetical protein